MPPSINYDSPGELKAFLKGHGMGMLKRYGQNFLINPAARLHLLDALELQRGDEVWEIGPGLGAMTAGLLERGGQVTAFEIDRAFAGVLLELFAGEGTPSEPTGRTPNEPSFRLIEGDVLKTWQHVDAAGKEPILFGNLPYNIAAALLADFIEKGRFFRRMVVTVQREVASRMAALPGSPEYSSFSVLCSSVYKVTPLKVIKSSSFYPAPKVDSQGVRLDLFSGQNALPKLFHPLVRALFSSRRKTIRNTLSTFSASVIINSAKDNISVKAFVNDTVASKVIAKDLTAEVLRRSNISGERRPETLGIDDFTALAALLEEVVANRP